jgi:hypothetical protein
MCFPKEKNMDMLTKLFNDFMDKAANDPTPLQLFQAGLTAGATSMRQRAMDCVTIPGGNWSQDNVINHIKNGIGQLSDIPPEK